MKRANNVCPVCGCRRWRRVAEIAAITENPREVVARIIECMKCDHGWIEGKTDEQKTTDKG